MNLVQYLKELRTDLKKSPRQRARELEQASGYEPGIKHPQHQTYLLCRDDGAVEMNAGEGTRILADKGSHMISIKAANIALEAENLHFHTAPGGLWFGYQRFNPEWFSPPLDFLSWSWRTAPLVQTYPYSLYFFPDATPAHLLYLSPTPPFLKTMPLSALFRQVPLFGPNEEYLVLAKNLGRLLNHMTDLLPGG